MEKVRTTIGERVITVSLAGHEPFQEIVPFGKMEERTTFWALQPSIQSIMLWDEEQEECEEVLA